VQLPPTDVHLVDAVARGLDTSSVRLGDPTSDPVGYLRTEAAGVFRLVGNRRPELAAPGLLGIPAAALRLFS
jgi:hypothetical protein